MNCRVSKNTQQAAEERKKRNSNLIFKEHLNSPYFIIRQTREQKNRLAKKTTEVKIKKSNYF